MVKTFDLTIRAILENEENSEKLIKLYDEFFSKMDDISKEMHGYHICASVYSNEPRPILKHTWTNEIRKTNAP